MEKYTLKQQRVIDQIKFPKRWELYNKGFSDRKIAEELNVNKNTIYHWRKVKNKLKPKGRTKIDRDIKVYKDGSIEKQRELNKIKFPKRWELYNKGFSDEEIAKEFDMKKESVRNWRVKYKLLTKEEIEKRKKLKTYKDGSIEEIRRLDRNKFPERWELYEEGMIDREIAEELGVSYAAISQWRRKIKLKAHGKTSLSKKENKKRMKLYKEGKNDREIAKVVGVNNEAIYKWRRDRDLPSNYCRKLSEEKHKRRLEYYNMGLTDAEIGEKVGKERNTIADWRRKNNLPLNSQITLSDEEHNKRLNLYKKNMNDREIAEIREVSSVTIRMWREKNNLPLVDKASSRESNFNYNPLTHAEIDLNIFTEEDKEILKIYLEGLNDGEMGKRLEMTRYSVSKWRDKYNLPSNYFVNLYKKKKRRLKYYNMGLTDKEIAEILNKNPDTIGAWRRDNNLPINHELKLSDEEHERRLKYYNMGLTDKEISEKIKNLSQDGVHSWRVKNGIPSHNHYNSPITEDQHEKRLKLYNMEMGDKEIAQLLNTSKSSIAHWRRKNNLLSNALKNYSNLGTANIKNILKHNLEEWYRFIGDYSFKNLIRYSFKGYNFNPDENDMTIIKQLAIDILKDINQYNINYKKDKYTARKLFLKEYVNEEKVSTIFEPFSGVSSFYDDYVKDNNIDLITNDIDLRFNHTTYNKDAEILIKELINRKESFDLVDFDPFGRTLENLDNIIKLSNKYLMVIYHTWGFSKGKAKYGFAHSSSFKERWKKYFGFKDPSNITIEQLMKHGIERGLKQNKYLKPVQALPAGNVLFGFYIIEDDSNIKESKIEKDISNMIIINRKKKEWKEKIEEYYGGDFMFNFKKRINKIQHIKTIENLDDVGISKEVNKIEFSFKEKPVYDIRVWQRKDKNKFDPSTDIPTKEGNYISKEEFENLKSLI